MYHLITVKISWIGVAEMDGIKREYIQEVRLIRVLACLSIVMLHSIKFTVGFSLATNASYFDHILLIVAGILAFGTPAFVFISELLLAHSYPDRIPKNFYAKRVSLILTPFFCMAVFYAIVSSYGNFSELPKTIFLNLIGGYHGWFVLVVFQFYLLHQFFTRYLSHIPSKTVLPVSFIINIAYLSVFNFIKVPSDSGVMAYIWDRGHWVPFFGWLFYFCIAYYCGKKYKSFLLTLVRYRVLVYASVLVSLVLFIYISSLNIFGFGSKRIDMIPLTVSLIFLLFIVASKFGIKSKIVDLINNCSFGIYLIHYFYLILYSKVIDFVVDIGYWKIPVLFVTALVSSIITVLIANMIPFGKYILGKSAGIKIGRIQLLPRSRKVGIKS